MREILYFAAHGLNTGFVRIFYFPKRLHFNKITFPPQSPYSSQTGHGVAGMVLRNVAPRQGTETLITLYKAYTPVNIEKCSSPIGDGNSDHRNHSIFESRLRNVAPRQGTETLLTTNKLTYILRNVAPRQGTETQQTFFLHNSRNNIEKCSSPIGDGNFLQ